MEVGDVVVTDNKDGSHTVSFRPRHGGMLNFEVVINGIPAPSCSLTKQVRWVISDVYGKGVVSYGGLIMKGVGREGEICCRVGECCFEFGVHLWKAEARHSVHLTMPVHHQHNLRANDMFGRMAFFNQLKAVEVEVEVGVID